MGDLPTAQMRPADCIYLSYCQSFELLLKNVSGVARTKQDTSEPPASLYYSAVLSFRNSPLNTTNAAKSYYSSSSYCLLSRLVINRRSRYICGIR